MNVTAKKLSGMIPNYKKILQYDSEGAVSRPVSKPKILKQLEADHPSRMYSIDTVGSLLVIGVPETEVTAWHKR